MTDNRQVKATPPDVLADLFMDPNRARPEAEHWAVREIENLREENERLRAKDAKTRHALKGWVWVCPDGGDEPTHERVAAVVAEVGKFCAENERLRAERNTLLLDARNFVRWFNRHYPDPTSNPDHPWCAINSRLNAHADVLETFDSGVETKETDYHEGFEEGWNAAQRGAATVVERMREVLIEWDALIQYQYSGSRDAMTDMQHAALRTKQILDELDAPRDLEAKP